MRCSKSKFYLYCVVSHVDSYDGCTMKISPGPEIAYLLAEASALDGLHLIVSRAVVHTTTNNIKLSKSFVDKIPAGCITALLTNADVLKTTLREDFHSSSASYAFSAVILPSLTAQYSGEPSGSCLQKHLMDSSIK